MKYMLLLNNDAADVEDWHQLSEEEVRDRREQVLPQWNDLFRWIGEQGLEVEGLELDDVDQARVVRVRDGETLISDGPYAETKEIIGGYFIADCKDLDQAIELAEHVPLVGRGSVEIRPLVTR
jgi:hypothetical protein